MTTNSLSEAASPRLEAASMPTLRRCERIRQRPRNRRDGHPAGDQEIGEQVARVDGTGAGGVSGPELAVPLPVRVGGP